MKNLSSAVLFTSISAFSGLGCAHAEYAKPARSIALAGQAPISMDYLAYDASTDRVWIPAGNTGRVDVLEVKTGAVMPIEGFETKKVQRRGEERTVGPSSASAGEGFVYVGSRVGKLCTLDARTLEQKGCIEMPFSPDGTAYVATTHEVWVTMPRDNSIAVLELSDPAAPKLAAKIAVEGPEGYAVDGRRGLFYTNQEDSDRTVVIDVKSRAVIATWESGCGKEGPRGLAVDGERQQLFVACASGKIRAFDSGKGTFLSEIDTGAGLDNIDYAPANHLVFAAAGDAATLAVLQADEKGALKKIATVAAAEGGRVVVVDKHGTAYIADSKGGRLVAIDR